MNYNELKKRRIVIVPPLPVKQDIVAYSKGNMSEFIIDAVREKIKAIKAQDKERNSVAARLGSP